MKKLLFLLDTDPIANTFDTVVGYDGGADHVTPCGGMDPDTVVKMVEGAIFTRAPKHKQNTALFVTGSNMADGEILLAAIKQQFFGNFRVSVMLDSNGSNTTAAATVALVAKHGSLSGKRAVVLAGTGPVGQRAAVMLAKEGADVLLTSRKLERAEAAAKDMNERFGVSLGAAAGADPAAVKAALEGAHICVATGAAGIQLLSEEMWRDHPTLEILADANATPPLGLEGVDMMDKGVERHGKIAYGAIGVGGLKIELHRACVGKLFESNDQVFDAEEIFTLAKEMV